MLSAILTNSTSIFQPFFKGFYVLELAFLFPFEAKVHNLSKNAIEDLYYL
jgi:TRAP-type C4-dicarboxylate transport system substrate-binding protein